MEKANPNNKRGVDNMRKITSLIAETFNNQVEKENAENLMNALFPKGGTVVTSGVVRGEVGLKGWKKTNIFF